MEQNLLQSTITIGDLMTLAGSVGAILAAYVAIAIRMARLETQVVPVWQWFIAERHREKRGRDGDA